MAPHRTVCAAIVSLFCLLDVRDGAAQTLPVAEQNALIARHCAVCHNDATPNGGLSLQRFDVRRAPDSLMAMLLSKMAQGLSVETLQSARVMPAARALVASRMKGGAMMAAGVPPPPDETMYALIEALAAQTRNARAWNIENGRTAGGATTIAASTLREAPREEGHSAMYRLIASCSQETRAGELRVSWSPMPKEGTLMVAVDDGVPIGVTVAGLEKMGNGLPGLTPPASVVLRGISFPERSLTLSGLLGDTVRFNFDALPEQVRRTLLSCFWPARR